MRIVQVLALLVALLGVGAVVAVAAGPVTSETPAAAASAPASPAADTAAPAATTPAEQAQASVAFSERAFGKPDAPVTLVEYAALTCPHCAHLHLTVMPRIKQNYIDKGLVRIVFNDFPFDEIGLKAAMVSRCLPAEQYYDFLQTLFASQTQWANPSVGDTVLKQMAGFVGMTPEKYDACVKNSELSDTLLKIRVQATNDFQISSTPTMLVQGTLERVVGAQDYEEYRKVIDAQLTKLGITPPVQEPAPAAPAPAPAAH